MREENNRRVNLTDRIEYYMNCSDKETVKDLFSTEEWDILCTLQEGESLRAATEQADAGMEESDAEKVLKRLEIEKEVSLRLKEQVIHQINILLKQESIDGWIQILTWYQLLDRRKWIHRFWEFHILKTILDIFVEELKVAKSEGYAISVLTLHSMDEMTEIYFRMIFFLRRIEYEVGTVEEFKEVVKRWKLSPVFVTMILETGRIFNKEKVNRKINR